MNDRVLTRRGELLGELLRLSRYQADALACDRIDEFLAHMPRRKEIFLELRESELPLPANLLAFPTPNPSGGSAEAHALIPALVEAVLAQDEHNARKLREAMLEVRRALRQVRLGFEAAHGYSTAAAGASPRTHLDVAI